MRGTFLQPLALEIIQSATRLNGADYQLQSQLFENPIEFAHPDIRSVTSFEVG